MSFATIWSELATNTRAWLIAHNGEPLAREIVTELIDRSGTSAPGWIDFEAPDGPTLTDETIDWIEATANDESGTA